MDPLEFLAQHAPFDALDASARRLVGTALEIAYVPAGDVVLRRGGEIAERLYVVRKGAVRLERDGQIQQVIEPGECFGFPSLIGRAAPTADAIASDDTLLYQLPRAAFDLLMERRAFADFFLLDLGARLRQATASNEPRTAGLALATEIGVLVRAEPVYIAPARTVAEAASAMQAAGVGALLVEGTPLGIVTDADLRNRVLAAGLGPETRVDAIVTRPVKTIGDRASLIDVLAFMLEHRVHHAPVERAGRIIGVLSDTDLLRLQVRTPLYLLRNLDQLAIPGDLGRYAGDVAGMVESLLWGGLDALQVGPIVSRLNDALTTRLLRAAVRALGAPPAAYAWMAMGAEGRGEQALLTDQDNALALGADTPEVEAYFAQVAETVVNWLTAADFPACAGGFMATSWRMGVDAWQRRIHGWLGDPSPRSLIAAMNIFDFRAVAGDLPLDALQDAIWGLGRERLFLSRFARASMGLEPPIGLFRQIQEEEHGLDLKKGAIVPIVNIARLYALEAQSPARSTLERLAAASDAGTLSQTAASTLREAFRFACTLRLRAQLEARRRGEAVSNHVQVSGLPWIDVQHLKQVFLEIRQIQSATALRHGTERLA